MDITEDNYVAGLQAKNEKALKFFIEHDDCEIHCT